MPLQWMTSRALAILMYQTYLSQTGFSHKCNHFVKLKLSNLMTTPPEGGLLLYKVVKSLVIVKSAKKFKSELDVPQINEQQID